MRPATSVIPTAAAHITQVTKLEPVEISTVGSGSTGASAAVDGAFGSTSGVSGRATSTMLPHFGQAMIVPMIASLRTDSPA